MSYQRLESSTINPELSGPLRSVTADPLWFLGRQWQVGELQGEDGGRPIAMRIASRSARPGFIRGGPSSAPRGRRRPLIDGPLEPQVEADARLKGPATLMWSARLGAQALRMLSEAGAPVSAIDAIKADFGLKAPDGLRPVDRILCERGVDGLALVEAHRSGRLLGSRIVTRVLNAFATEVERQLDIDEAGETIEAWNAERQEYQFHLTTTDSDTPPLTLDAAEYHGRRADWFSFDVDRTKEFDGWLARRRAKVNDVLASPIRFAGAPATRWWEVENESVDMAHLEGTDADLARAVVAGFITTFGNDWYMAPIDAQLGDLVEISKVEVIDSFGDVTLVPPLAAEDDDTAPERPWKFFELTGDTAPANGAAPLLYIAPTAATVLAGADVERVMLAHDEVSNLGWAIEEIVESVYGRPVDRTTVATEIEASTEGGTETDADLRYQLDPEMPEHWLPLVAVDRTGSPGRWRQRGRMTPPIGAPDGWGAARGRLLEPGNRLLIHEEEIPRSGAVVIRRTRATRSHDGRLLVWASRRKRLDNVTTSGAYVPDQIIDTANPSEPNI